MMDWAKARPTGSLFVQLLTLTGLTLVLSWAMKLADLHPDEVLGTRDFPERR